MRNVSVLVKRITGVVASAADAAVRGVAEMLDAAVPRPTAQLVPVRVRRDERRQRR